MTKYITAMEQTKDAFTKEPTEKKRDFCIGLLNGVMLMATLDDEINFSDFLIRYQEVFNFITQYKLS